jgi:X-X-X-Leu-X-X-Gly heptad repeat protein
VIRKEKVVARHRSPQGRRAHLGLPLSASMATAGAGGARSLPLPQLTSSLPVRFVATLVAGGALAVGQHALTEALPADGANALQSGVEQLVSGAPQAAAATVDAPLAATVDAPLAAASLAGVAPAAPEPVVADAAHLVKAADLQSVAAETAARATETATRAVEAARVAEEAKVVEAARVAEAAKQVKQVTQVKQVAAAPTGVQMIVGRVSSGFGARGGTAHQGLDIAAPIGTPIRVPLAGTVIDSGPASGFGLWVRVKHADGTITVYGHINRSLVGKGQAVSAGQQIAEVGNRGQSTGPHLHIEVITPGGVKINPRPWLDARGIGYA